MDIQINKTAAGRTLNLLKGVDKNSRQCLRVQIGQRGKVNNMIPVLEEITNIYQTLKELDLIMGQNYSRAM